MKYVLATLGLLCAADAWAGPATELKYRGSVEPVVRGEDTTITKSFDLYYLVTGAPVPERGFFVLDERGAGGWGWPERFGTVDLQAADPAQRQVQLLHELGGILHPLPVTSPYFHATQPMAEGATWEQDTQTFVVAGQGQRNERDCWRVTMTGRVGRAQTLWVEKETGLVVAAEQRAVIGRGDEFRIVINLESADAVDSERADSLQAAAELLLKLQSDLQRKVGTTEPDLTDAQLVVALAAADDLKQLANDTPLGQLATTIVREVQAQQQRSGEIGTVADRFLNQPAPKFELTGLDGAAVPPEDHAGKIVVLHFWKYHGEPLTEPYGQVGYLDFLNERRGKMGVKTYGVAVDARLGDPQTRGSAVRQVRKLQEFFSLGYPITTDNGALLKRFGDPQRLGGKLPLWVVIAPDGTVVHYKVGTYDIRPDEGLKPLDAVLVDLIRSQRGAEPVKQ